MTERYEVEVRFSNHPLTEQNQLKVARLRAQIKESAHELLTLVPRCIERQKALTSLDQALMWAVAAIARQRARDE